MDINDNSIGIEKQYKNTIKKTKDIFKLLAKTYNDKIMIKKTSSSYEPKSETKDFSIDGINVKNSYVRNAYLRLNEKTDYVLKINDKVIINIHFYHINGKMAKLMIECVRRVYCMIKVFGSYKNMDKYGDMDIDILLYDAPRVMTDTYASSTREMDYIGKDCYFNCTCGYATIIDNKFKICVSRCNGCLGLLVHELGHICELDLGNFDDERYNFPTNRLNGWKTTVKKYFDIDEHCHIGNMTEGINNGNSSIIHSMFLALENGNKRTCYAKYEEYYRMEYLYAIKMYCKLMRWFKYNSIRELVRRDKCKFVQRSQLLEYIVIRCIYLMNFEQIGMIKTGAKGKFEINDDKYVLKFFECMRNSRDILDVILSGTINCGILSMEYYYNK